MLLRSMCLIGAGVVSTVVPGPLAAQSCIGMPIDGGFAAISGHIAGTDGTRSYGGTLTGNFLGPATFQVGYTLTTFADLDSNTHGFHTGLGYEVSASLLSVCPWAGAQYSTWTHIAGGYRVTVGKAVFPVGIGIGSEFQAGQSAMMSVFAFPQARYVHRTNFTNDGFNRGSNSDSATEFGIDVGIRIRRRGVFGGGGLAFATNDESPAFSAMLGFVVGRDR